MSLPAFVVVPMPVRLEIDLEELCPKIDRFRIFSEKIYPLLVEARPSLEKAYCLDNGRPGIEPVLLMGVSLLQFMEKVSERQAVELLRYHAGWNLALHRSLGQEPGFDRTVLVYFRERLLKHKQGRLVFDRVLAGLVAAGLVARRSKQRLDSTQMDGLLRRMSRLECVRETLGLALEELSEDPAMARPACWTELWQGYVQEGTPWLESSQALWAKLDQVGSDALRLLGWLDQPGQKGFGTGPQVALLRRVVTENFDVPPRGGAPVRRTEQPPGAVQNPHDPDAQWAAKGQGEQRKEHVGYKVQMAETVQEEKLEKNEPTRHFLTAIVTQPAISSDEAGLEAVEAEQAEIGLLERAPTWYVDGAYVSAEKLAQADQENRELIGPAQPALCKQGRFGAEDFEVRVEQRQATCPAGKTSTQCSRLEEKKGGRVNYRFEWSTHCHACQLRSRCVGPGQKHRSLLVGQHHSFLQARRLAQKTEAFRRQCHHRNAIEGTGSELKRAHGLHRARYRGLNKVRLQNYFIGAACNAKRWIARLIWECRQATRTAPLPILSG